MSAILFYYFLILLLCWSIEIVLYFFYYKEIKCSDGDYVVYKNIQNAEKWWIGTAALLKAIFWPIFMIRYPVILLKIVINKYRK